jgi:hypothetical protein
MKRFVLALLTLDGSDHSLDFIDEDGTDALLAS